MGLLGVLLVVVVLTVIPVGARLLQAAPPMAVWVATGALAVVGLARPTGPAAVALVLPWGALTGVTAARGVLLLRRHEPVRAVAAASAALSLAIAGGALVVDRTGVELWAFDHERWRLTVLHFCIAGFACSLLAGLTHLATGAARTVVLALPVGTGLVAVGHFAGAWVELAGALVLTAALLVLSATVVRRLAHDSQLLLVSALTPVATMALALWWAAGEALGIAHPSIAATAATHGVANALGVGLCGVLGWTQLTKERL